MQPVPTDPKSYSDSTGRAAMGRRLCFGGSFNPIHHGHLRCARAAASFASFEQVILIPSAQPPHKPVSADLASVEDRLAMTRLAANDQGDEGAGFAVDDLECRRAGPSYTIDTARELRARGWREIWWLIGADMLNTLPTWHQADRLIEEVHFLILARPGVPLRWDGLSKRFRDRLEMNVVPAPLIDISATEIRRRVRAGESIDALTPTPIVEYIHDHGLYRA